MLFPLPLVGQERQCLGRAARLGGDDTQRPRRIERLFIGGHRGGVGGIEDVDVEALVRVGIGPGQDLRRERGAAHAADQRVGVALAHDLRSECGQLRNLILEERWRIQPAEALGDFRRNAVIVGPEARIAGPDAAGPAVADGSGDGLVDAAL